MSPQRIDTHFHILSPKYTPPPSGNTSGSPWPIPSWSPASAIATMDTLGTAKGVLSNTASLDIAGQGEQGRNLTRLINEETKGYADEYPDRFSWFASLPDWSDVNGTLSEIEWALDEAMAEGVVALTSYDNMLLGNPSFKQIWDKLDELQAVVFIHPTSLAITPPLVASNLLPPVIDYPLASTRTAMDLIYTKTFSSHPNVKVILPHLGGTLPFLEERILSIVPEGLYNLTRDDVQRDLKRFWLDLAMSTSKPQLRSIGDFTTPDKILYGSDCPYVTVDQASHFAQLLDDFSWKEPGGSSLGIEKLAQNARNLLGWNQTNSR